MAQSHNGSIIDDHDLGASFEREDLPKGEARLVIHDDGVTTVIQDDREKVRERFYEEIGRTDFDPDDYSMPDSDKGLVPAAEFYGDDEG